MRQSALLRIADARRRSRIGVGCIAALVVTTPGVVALHAAAAPVLCHGQTATMVGTTRAERLVGTTGPDVIQARGGHDIITGLGGDDVICGGAGSDDLIGGDGNDELYGGPDGWVDEDRAGFFTAATVWWAARATMFLTAAMTRSTRTTSGRSVGGSTFSTSPQPPPELQ